jgi:soluble lytic murein transglycosylase-like protein
VTAFDDLILDACARHGVDPHLVQAVIHVESAHQPHARSSKGALGLMQVMPATGARYGVSQPRQLLEPELNIDVGTRYLRDLHKLFGGRIELVLAAYNAGEGAVARYGNRIPPYSETREYVRRALLMYRQRQLLPSGPQRLNPE